MKQIIKKSQRMKEVELEHGMQIEEILRHMYVDLDMPMTKIAKELGVEYAKLNPWFKKAGVYSRRLW